MPIGSPAIQRVARWPVRHPQQALLILLVLLIAGVLASAHVPIKRHTFLPNTSLVLSVDLPGIDIARLDAEVAQPLEKQLADVPGVRHTETRVSPGHARLVLDFVSPNARERAFGQVRALATDMQDRFPSGMDAPHIERGEARAGVAVVYGITAAFSAATQRWVEQALRRPLTELPQVGAVNLEGADESMILIQPDPRRIAGLGLSFDDVLEALRRSDQAPTRRSSRRQTTTTMPAGAQAITTRAVRLPGGDPIALGEIADVSLVTVPAGRKPTDAAGLRLVIYPTESALAARLAERAHAYLGWMRANGMVPADVRIETLFSEADQTRRWLRRTLYVCAIYIAAVLLFAYALFGLRALSVSIGASICWLAMSIGVFAALDGSLNPMTLLGLIAAFVPAAAVMTAAAVPAVALLLAVVASVFALSVANGFPALAQASVAFTIAAVSAAIVGWLLKGWTPKNAPPRRRGLMIGLTMVVASAAAVLMYAYAPVSAETRQVLRIQGDDETGLIAVADGLLPSLRDAAGQVADQAVQQYSATRAQHWHLEPEPERMDAQGITVAQAGRALAIATEGLTAGELIDADVRLPLRVRLAPRATGDNFERLVLRGESSDEKAVYLRDVGSARQRVYIAERIRVDGVPAVEITLALPDDVKRQQLERWLATRDLSGNLSGNLSGTYRYRWISLPAY